MRFNATVGIACLENFRKKDDAIGVNGPVPTLVPNENSLLFYPRTKYAIKVGFAITDIRPIKLTGRFRVNI